jgi:hypothetical protein
MYTTIIIVESENRDIQPSIDNFLIEWGAEIDQEFENIVQYTLISKHAPDFTEFEDFVKNLDDPDVNVQYVCCDFSSAYINGTRRYCGCWYND